MGFVFFRDTDIARKNSGLITLLHFRTLQPK